MELGLIIRFLVLTFFVSGVIIFFLHRTLISSTEGAVKRLDEDLSKTKSKQNELNAKLKEADEELKKRRAEAEALADKLRTEAEEETKSEREKIINKAREEGEEIIEKAKNATEKMRKELEKEMDIKGVNFGMQLVNEVLNEKMLKALDMALIEDFIAGLKEIDTSNVSAEVDSMEIVTLNAADPKYIKQIEEAITKKLGRALKIKTSQDKKIGGGIVLKFGTMALDGSIRNALRDKAIALQQVLEDKVY